MTNQHHIQQANPTTLVLGATGKTGRRVAQRLAARGIPHRPGSRSAPIPFDWQDATTWAPVLDGVTAAYVAFQPDVAYPGAVEVIGSFAERAVAAGVERLVLLSGRGEAGARAAEAEVQSAGAEWTIVRASWFFQNFSEHFLLDPVRSGVIALPAGQVAEPFIDAEDIADVAVAALTEDGHTGRCYDVTGPRLLTFAQVAEAFTAALGREVRYVPVTPAEYAAAAVEYGIPAEEAQPLSELFAEVLDGRNATVADGVREALGRAPRDLADYLHDTVPTGVWNPPAFVG